MKIIIVTPAVNTTVGNSITAHRWADVLRSLGHHVDLATEWRGDDCDLLIALHAGRSSASIKSFRDTHASRPLIVALTGTDLYRDLRADKAAERSLALATRIVALQSRAADELNGEARSRLRVIYQSAVPPAKRESPPEQYFDVCVLSHLRDVKDPLRAAWASRRMPPESRVRVIHAGRPLEPKWEELALEEERNNPRYQWLRELPHDAAMQLLARSRLLVVPSEAEGGANVIAEAVVCSVPVICSAIPGNIGMLGADYPGYFPVKQTAVLTDLLHRAETSSTFLASLRIFVDRLQKIFDPDQEKKSWAQLLEEM